MDEQRLAEIRAWERAMRISPLTTDPQLEAAYRIVAQLLVELDRRAEIISAFVNLTGDQETRHQIVQAVAERSVDDNDRCILGTCDTVWDADTQRWVHAPDCLVSMAQAEQVDDA